LNKTLNAIESGLTA